MPLPVAEFTSKQQQPTTAATVRSSVAPRGLPREATN